MQRYRIALLVVLLAAGCATTNPVAPNEGHDVVIVLDEKTRPTLYQDDWPDHREDRDGAK